jgi:hypothetical protein
MTCHNNKKHIPNVTLTNQNSSMMNRLSQPQLENLSLKTTFQEILNLQPKHIIQLRFGLIQHADTNQPTNERIAFKETLGVLLGEREEVSRGSADLGESEPDAVDFSLVFETVFSGEFELLVETG